VSNFVYPVERGVERYAPLHRIWEISGSDFGPKTGYLDGDVFRNSPKFPCTNAEMMALNLATVACFHVHSSVSFTDRSSASKKNVSYIIQELTSNKLIAVI
jgi:hypothetical protein